jgi:hypothetical protein
MSKFKSHKTVEQIAKKHRLDVSFIQKQLDMGEPIEHEHTKDHKLARDIALQHLDEIPDYYTRLKKMESSAKKEHKKFKDVKEDTKSGDSNLRDWFNKSSGTDPKTGRKVKGWVQIGGPFAGAPCARQPGQKSTPKCGSSKMAADLSDKEEDKAFKRKNREDPNQPQKKGAAKPTNVRTEEMNLQEKKKEGKKDACYNKVKSRYDVWPSAYASGALVKCRKVGAANWGTKSEATMHEEERYCPLCNKRETRSECSYGEKAWDKVSVKDEEYSMVRSELSAIENAIERLKSKVGKGEGNLEAWVQSKITKAADYIDTAADYIASGEMEESFVFKKRIGILKGKDTQIAKSSGVGALSPEAARELGDKAVELRKKKLAKTELPKINKEETLVDKIVDEIVVEKCWPGYKRKKETTEFSKGSCVKAENVTIEDADGNTFAEVVDLIKPEPIKGFKSQIKEATRLQAQTGNVIAVTLSWRGKYYYMKMFFPQVKTPSRREINDELQKVYPGSTVVYHSISEIQPGQPLIQAFGPQGGSYAKLGPSKNYVKTMGEEIEINEDWQKVNRQDKTDGLSQKAVDAYRRENPGSKLQTAVTEKNPKGERAGRRKRFCSRMSGMKKRLTSAKTARDPNSDINKALRRWNCR